MNTAIYAAHTAEPHRVDAISRGQRARANAKIAWIGETLWFSIDGLESYFFSGWRPDLYDLLIVAGAIEFCDVSYRRPALGWARNFNVRVAVHEPRRWSKPSVQQALVDAANFLTGDLWSFDFVLRKRDVPSVRQGTLELPSGARVIMPYSEGLDSRAVAALVEAKEKSGLVRVRLGSFGSDRRSHDRRKRPFAVVPYEVKLKQHDRRESSARSRAFKFAVITGIAATLAQVERIVVTESGQGAMGPVLAVTGQGYPDYRVHPAFTERMERLFAVLLEKKIRFEYPRLWHTKGETLAEANALGTFEWADTRSCWQSSRHVSVEHHRRQCGVCAACMLRRMSMLAAGLLEPASIYVWENLSAANMRDGAVDGFSRHSKSMDEYAIAGVLHLDQLAEMANSDLYESVLSRSAGELSRAIKQSKEQTLLNMNNLLARHQNEWKRFLASLKPESFVRRIAVTPAA